ncbi:MAG: hypothetical protein HC800_10160 [Phormidesmis sp. RL_2_1]|nr:hypothetical protein [Phormidesmis sp. RL_2_1]
MTAFTADNGDINVNIDVLERQIFEETGGAIEVDLSILGTSTTDIASATESFNTFFTSLTSEQLALAVESPTLMVLWRLLQAAYEATEGEVSTVPGGGLASIVSILLLL